LFFRARKYFRGGIILRRNFKNSALKQFFREVKIFRATARNIYDTAAWPKRNLPRRRLKKPAKKRSSNVFVAPLLFSLNTGHPSRCFFLPGLKFAFCRDRFCAAIHR